MIMEPRQRGQVRGSAVFMRASSPELAKSHAPAPTGRSESERMRNHLPSRAYGVSCRVRAGRLPYRSTPLRSPPDSPLPRYGRLVPPPSRSPATDLRKVRLRTHVVPRAPSPRRLRRVCDFMNIVRLKPPAVNSLPVNQCDLVRRDPVDLRKPEPTCRLAVPPPPRWVAGRALGAAIGHMTQDHPPPYSSARRSSRIGVPSRWRRRGL